MRVSQFKVPQRNHTERMLGYHGDKSTLKTVVVGVRRAAAMPTHIYIFSSFTPAVAAHADTIITINVNTEKHLQHFGFLDRSVSSTNKRC